MIFIGEISLTSSVSNIIFSNVPQTFRNLQLILSSYTSVSTPAVYIQLNGDTAANYASTLMSGVGTSSISSNSSSTSTPQLIKTAPSLPMVGASTVTIFDYARTVWYKNLRVLSGSKINTTSGCMEVIQSTIIWRSTAAVTSILIAPATGSFISGTVATLYGLN